ncbi:tyrosine-type recombinase/integrase [Mesorhizobium sophorae]|uniref:tyrosine-type recombinase/integrase n=1 Tax=Mesorhizobium sophorae TaxID=1300294 RepID=UPI000BA48FEC|nr:tyrosine-type recombinase/integrase [Mesorhizobium sophorae]
MPTERVRIGAKHIKEARKAAEARTYGTSGSLIFADTGEINLKLRVQGATAAWIVKWNGQTVKLGTVDDVGDADMAREMTREVLTLLKAGKDAKAYVAARLAGEGTEAAAVTATASTARKDGKWTWAEMVRQYADVYLSNPRTNSRGETKTPSLESVKEVKRYLLKIPETHHLHNRLLSTLRRGDLEKVRNALAEAGKMAPSRQFVAYAKAALSYAEENDSDASGLDDDNLWWHKLKKRQETIPQAKTRHPSLAETATLLYLAEKHRVMPERRVERETSLNAVCSLWWLALTGQRASAGLKLLKKNILPWPGAPDHLKDWKIAFFPAHTMKGKRAHSLPIPPRVALLLQRAATATARDSEYVFPATRLQGGKVDAHLSRSTPRLLIQRLRGRPADLKAHAEARKKAKKDGIEFPEMPDLLGDIEEFSTHDFRTTFATEGGNLTVRGDAISAVLDHQSIQTGDAPRFAAPITRQAYDFSQKLELKAIAMEAWTTALFDAVEKEWAKHRPFSFKAFRQVLPLDHVLVLDHGGTASKKSSTHTPLWYQEMESKEAIEKSKPRAQLSELRKSSDE